jgi:hypothetical protein
LDRLAIPVNDDTALELTLLLFAQNLPNADRLIDTQVSGFGAVRAG